MKLLASLGSATARVPVLCLTLCAVGYPALAQSPGVTGRAFRDLEPVAAPGLDAAAAPGLRRPIDIDVAALRAGRAGLRLDLFGGEVATAQQPKLSNAHGGGLIWRAALDGNSDGADYAAFSIVGDAVTATIHRDGRTYRVASAGNGAHWLTEWQASRAPRCGVEPVVTPSAATAGQFPSAPVGSPPASARTSPTVDVMVVYSTEAKDEEGGTAAMLSLINLAIDETNQGYANSGVHPRLALIHTEEMVGYAEPSNFSSILSDLAGQFDGKMDHVHPLRDQHGADLVAMLVDNDQLCGLSYLMTTVSPTFEDRAFSVINRECATVDYGFGHQVGHNFGCAHEPASAGSAAYAFSYGYRTPDQRFRTIMALDPGTRVPIYSGEASVWGSYIMGQRSQNNSRSLNNAAATVAAWRASASGSFTLSVSNLVGGATAILATNGASPGRLVQTAYSVTGAGPIATRFGPISLSVPVRLLPAQFASSGGTTSVPLAVPAAAAGRNIWFQAVDVFSSTVSNSLPSRIR
ncbi:MAG: reprolysin-like metallopeptidase [Planctomycetota bacterium]